MHSWWDKWPHLREKMGIDRAPLVHQTMFKLPQSCLHGVVGCPPCPIRNHVHSLCSDFVLIIVAVHVNVHISCTRRSFLLRLRVVRFHFPLSPPPWPNPPSSRPSRQLSTSFHTHPFPALPTPFISITRRRRRRRRWWCSFGRLRNGRSQLSNLPPPSMTRSGQLELIRFRISSFAIPWADWTQASQVKCRWRTRNPSYGNHRRWKSSCHDER